MDWAVGLAANRGQLVAEVAFDGMVEVVDLSALQKRGVPVDTSTRQGRVQLDFSQWTRTEASDYLNAFGIADEVTTPSSHQVFTTVHNGMRLFVPALVWIRALFRPSAHLLPRAFGPHFLDFVSHISSDDAESQVVLDTDLVSHAQINRLSCPEQALTWMRAHPSASSMVSSVHRYAMEGAIGLDLPAGQATLAVRGRRVGKSLFVTDMSIYIIEAADAPNATIAGAPNTSFAHASGRYVLMGSSFENSSSTSFRVADFTDIPTHPDGRSDVTDEEWDAISSHFLSTGKSPTRLDQRAILDGLLCKLSTGMGWKTVQYRAGNHMNVSQAFRNWSSRGTLQKVLETLRVFRASPC